MHVLGENFVILLLISLVESSSPLLSGKRLMRCNCPVMLNVDHIYGESRMHDVLKIVRNQSKSSITFWSNRSL
jgi:hypothetical protein